MRILAFESSAKAASVALLEEDRLIGEYYQNSGQTHSRTIMKLAQDLLGNCDLTVRDLDAVACAIGPGSFTGLRIGLAAAKGLCWGGELPFYGVSTLEAMAYSAAHLRGIVCPVMDARRSQVYTAAFEAGDGGLRRVAPDQAISLEQLAGSLGDGTVYLLGDGAHLAKQAMPRENVFLLPEHLRQQRASGVALAARAMALRGEPGIDAALAVPNYLRLPQAERERLARINKSPDAE